jgi:hypothetical protein
MRFLSSWPQYLATADQGGVQLHQFASAEIHAPVGGGTVRLATQTAYPWDGSLQVTVLEAPERPWTLSIRVPGWCRSAAVRVPGGERVRRSPGSREVTETRSWQPGDSLTLDLDMPVRVTEPDPRIDAVRGCVALERGPLIYCIETADLPDGVQVEEIELEPGVAPVALPRSDVAESLVGLAVPAGRRRDRRGDARADGPRAGESGRTSEHTPEVVSPVDVGAVPYFAWANRTVEAMRVWIPRRSPAGDGRRDDEDLDRG